MSELYSFRVVLYYQSNSTIEADLDVVNVTVNDRLVLDIVSLVKLVFCFAALFFSVSCE